MDGIPLFEKLILRDAEVDAEEWEQIVFAEVLIPDTPNTYGDVYTRRSIKEFAYEFAKRGHGIDVQHDNEDIRGTGAYIAETFIARDGDPDFIPGSWVVGMKVEDPEVWQDILDGNINGYSYEAFVSLMPVIYEILAPRVIDGVTEPYPLDGHTHGYTVFLDDANTVIGGGTTETDGHSHTISTHTTTDRADDHIHRYAIHPQPNDSVLEAIQ